MMTEEFLSAQMARTQAELSGAILNRSRWDALCEDRRMLTFLQRRAGAADFQGVQAELQSIAEGRTRVPDVSGPRRKAEDCLRAWTTALEHLEDSAVTPNP
jgi:hypothetical protein